MKKFQKLDFLNGIIFVYFIIFVQTQSNLDNSDMGEKEKLCSD